MIRLVTSQTLEEEIRQARETLFFIDAVAVRGSGYVCLGQLPLPFVLQGMG
jgi:hypothetical protein